MMKWGRDLNTLKMDAGTYLLLKMSGGTVVCAGAGAAIGALLGVLGGPLAPATIPAGAVIGALIGGILGAGAAVAHTYYEMMVLTPSNISKEPFLVASNVLGDDDLDDMASLGFDKGVSAPSSLPKAASTSTKATFLPSGGGNSKFGNTLPAAVTPCTSPSLSSTSNSTGWCIDLIKGMKRRMGMGC